MEKEFVNYEQALALKELGFDEPCFTKFENYFNRTKLQPIIATLALNSPYENEYNGYDQKIINDNTRRWFFTGYKNSIKDHNQNILSAPLYQQAFKWFRKVHNLHGFIENSCIMNDNNYNCFINATDQSIVGLKSKRLFNMYNFKTYEEAELECLKKLIEIIKNK